MLRIRIDKPGELFGRHKQIAESAIRLQVSARLRLDRGSVNRESLRKRNPLRADPARFNSAGVENNDTVRPIRKNTCGLHRSGLLLQISDVLFPGKDQNRVEICMEGTMRRSAEVRHAKIIDPLRKETQTKWKETFDSGGFGFNALHYDPESAEFVLVDRSSLASIRRTVSAFRHDSARPRLAALRNPYRHTALSVLLHPPAIETYEFYHCFRGMIRVKSENISIIQQSGLKIRPHNRRIALFRRPGKRRQNQRNARISHKPGGCGKKRYAAVSGEKLQIRLVADLKRTEGGSAPFNHGTDAVSYLEKFARIRLKSGISLIRVYKGSGPARRSSQERRDLNAELPGKRVKLFPADIPLSGLFLFLIPVVIFPDRRNAGFFQL